MSRKFLKILFIFLIVFSLCISYVFATDIDLDLPTNNNETNQTENNVGSDLDNTNQNVTDNSVDNTNNVNDEMLGSDTYNDPFDTDNDSETLQPSTLSSAPQDGLSVSNIINILLITVGVIIILLAIAILIRLRG